jgi:hypothetical protein
MGYTYNIVDMSESDVDLYIPRGSYVLYEFSAEKGPELAVRVGNPPRRRGDYPEDPELGVWLTPIGASKEVRVDPGNIMFWTPTCGWYNLPNGPAYLERVPRRNAARSVLPQDLRCTTYEAGGTIPDAGDMRRRPALLLRNVYSSIYPTNKQEVQNTLSSASGVALNTTVALLHGEEEGAGVIRIGLTYAGEWRVSGEGYTVSPARPFNKLVTSTMTYFGLM